MRVLKFSSVSSAEQAHEHKCENPCEQTSASPNKQTIETMEKEQRKSQIERAKLNVQDKAHQAKEKLAVSFCSVDYYFLCRSKVGPDLILPSTSSRRRARISKRTITTSPSTNSTNQSVKVSRKRFSMGWRA